jgi:hypothetical protein
MPGSDGAVEIDPREDKGRVTSRVLATRYRHESFGAFLRQIELPSPVLQRLSEKGGLATT